LGRSIANGSIVNGSIVNGSIANATARLEYEPVENPCRVRVTF
jgi:hypothetical protein